MKSNEFTGILNDILSRIYSNTNVLGELKDEMKSLKSENSQIKSCFLQIEDFVK